MFISFFLLFNSIFDGIFLLALEVFLILCDYWDVGRGFFSGIIYSYVFLAMFIVGLIVVLAMPPYQSKTTSSNMSTKISTTTKQIPAESKIGDKAVSGSYVLIVNKVDEGVSFDWASPQPGDKFVIVNVTVENDGDSNIDYNEWSFKLQDSNGNITQLSMDGIGTNINWLNSGELLPGGKVTGSIAFEIASESKPVMLIWETGFLTGKVTIDFR